MSWIERDVAAEQFRKQIRVRLLRAQPSLSIIGPYQKAPTTTCRIENRVVGLADAESIYQVDDIVPSEMLAPAMPFLRADKPLEDLPNNVRCDVAEVVVFDPSKRRLPLSKRTLALEYQPPGPI